MLSQLQNTQEQLEEAKTQLRSTLAGFEEQRRAASDAEINLRKLDERQKAIELRTQELQKILEGKQPITVEDLQHSSNMGLVWGFLLGVVASLVANLMTTRFKTRNPLSDDAK